ncbi:L-histidine N(alpha)-methyltransferase [Vibrio sp. SM6]|uniref:L-histidine N(Alpha)-methyltransferase n=1 Tax=Vibrio agarilyticus TaxID=2726741 RepID=A0A7X8TNV7_9VIBR|nr:L-histidine N(alpha)-methyltransferase [Vibrio agarilyticus]NLS11984.1 L-histidine N(alpha)-methyltransferase [Vibrio agarilyticus]
MNKNFIDDVDSGLSQLNKKLPSKYFYDEKGDALFVEIMGLEEYYLTRSEMAIFDTQIEEIIAGFQLDKTRYFDLIELGAGDGSKTQKLLSALSQNGYHYDYVPIDISRNALTQLEQSLQQKMPQVNVKPQHGDYFEILETLKYDHRPKVLLFLGSNLGNMSDELATEFIHSLGVNLNLGDKILLGVDIIKPASVVLPAYNDAQGVTRAFNLNLLHRINTELGANFDLSCFEHTPEYSEDEGIAKSYLTSLVSQTVSIKAIGKDYHFESGEKIHTEISRKYDDKILSHILKTTRFSITDKFTDSKGYFCDYILTRLNDANP